MILTEHEVTLSVAAIAAVPACAALWFSRRASTNTKNLGNGFAGGVLSMLARLDDRTDATARQLEEHIAATQRRVRRSRPGSLRRGDDA